jgi:hypothetical protein
LPGGCGQASQRFPRIGKDRKGAELIGVAPLHVDADELHLGVLKQRVRAGGKIGQTRSNADDEIGLTGDFSGTGRARDPKAAKQERRLVPQRPLSRACFADGNPKRFDERLQLLARVGILDAPAGNEQRPLRLGQKGDRLLNSLGVRLASLDLPETLAEKLGGIIVGVRLYVLRKRNRHGACLRRVGQHAHGLGKRGQKLLGAADPVEEPTDRTETVVDARIRRDRVFQLLQHDPLVPGCVIIAGQQQHRQAIDGGGGRAGDHVGCPRPDGRRACQG